MNRHNFINYAIEKFVEDNFAGEEISEIKNSITKTEIKNLLHSHITGEIFDYARVFCNSILMEQENGEISFIAHNFFGFDLFYFIKTYIASVWGLKELNIGGNN